MGVKTPNRKKHRAQPLTVPVDVGAGERLERAKTHMGDRNRIRSCL